MNYELKANKLNESQRKEIKLHIERIIGHNSYNPSRDSMVKLFEYFNQYINCTPSDVDCGDCRRAIRDFWKKMLTIWNL